LFHFFAPDFFASSPDRLAEKWGAKRYCWVV
jgi:hypothetical protein